MFLSFWFHVDFSGCNILTPLTTWRKPAFAIFGTLAQKLIQLITIISPLRPSLRYFTFRCFSLSLVKTFPAISEMYHFGIVLGKLVDDFNSLHVRLAFRTRETFVDLFFPGGLGLKSSKWVWDPLSNLDHRGFLEISFSDPISMASNFQQDGGDLSQFSPPKTMVLIRSTASSTWKAQIQQPKLKLKTHQPDRLLTTSTFTNLSDYRRINHPFVQKIIPFPHSKLVSPIHPKEPKEQKPSLKRLKSTTSLASSKSPLTTTTKFSGPNSSSTACWCSCQDASPSGRKTLQVWKLNLSLFIDTPNFLNFFTSELPTTNTSCWWRIFFLGERRGGIWCPLRLKNFLWTPPAPGRCQQWPWRQKSRSLHTVQDLGPGVADDGNPHIVARRWKKTSKTGDIVFWKSHVFCSFFWKCC